MRSLIILAFALVLPAQAEAQAPAETPAPRLITVTAGSGNSMGWYGLQGERYLRSDRFSVFGGIGYVPEFEPGDASGVHSPGESERSPAEHDIAAFLNSLCPSSQGISLVSRSVMSTMAPGSKPATSTCRDVDSQCWLHLELATHPASQTARPKLSSGQGG